MPLAGPMYACMAWGRVLDMHIRAWHPSPGCRKRAFTAAVELVTDKAFWPRRYPAKAEFRRASPARGQADDRRVGDSFSAVGKSSGGPGRSGAEFLHQEVKAPGRGSWRRMAGNRADAAATVPRRDGDMARPQARTACPIMLPRAPGHAAGRGAKISSTGGPCRNLRAGPARGRAGQQGRAIPPPPAFPAVHRASR